jgi:hypothetical protein
MTIEEQGKNFNNIPQISAYGPLPLHRINGLRGRLRFTAAADHRQKVKI